MWEAHSVYLSPDSTTELSCEHVGKPRLLVGVAVMSLPPAILGVVALVVLSRFVSLQYGMKEFSLVVFVSIVLAIFIHEAAHIVATGTTYSIESISFSLLLPHVVLNIPYKDTHGQRNDAIRILAAGSLGNLGLALFFVAIFFMCDEVHTLAGFSILVNLLSIAINLTPLSFGGSGSDGLQILRLIKMENRR
ncbi:MAG: hypothetical protein HXS40_06265 [Theionarchaea archaeon]|nr:hypothetical protein [Theionarchaea archaeon]